MLREVDLCVLRIGILLYEYLWFLIINILLEFGDTFSLHIA